MKPDQPNNNSTVHNPVGRFMVAVGAVIELGNTGNILINQRSSTLDWNPGEWEIVYGRIDQFEAPEDGLKREVKEETGIEDLEIISVLTVWHIYRGTEKTAHNELIGITYYCRTRSEAISLSSEHDGYKWVTPQKALETIKVEGIQRDVKKFIEIKK